MNRRIDLKKCLARIICLLMVFSLLGEVPKAGAANYTSVHTWTLTKNDGSFNQNVYIQVLYEGGIPMFTWNETLDFDDGSYEELAEEMAQSLKTEYTFSVIMDYYVGGNTQTVKIVDVTYSLEQAKDNAGNNRWCLMFHFVLDPADTVQWRTGAAADVNLQLLGAPAEADPEAPQTYTNITKWRLVKADGSTIESAQGGSTIALAEKKDFESEEEAAAYASTLLEAYPQFCVETNYYPWLSYNLRILDLTFDHMATNGAVYKLTTHDNFRWHSNFGGQAAVFYILLPDSSSPVERRGVTAWRLVLKNGADPVVTARNDDAPYALPDIIEGADLAAYRGYAGILSERYDFQVSFDNNAVNFTTFEVKSFTYQPDYGCYLIVPYDLFYWNNNNQLNPRVTVRDDGSDPILRSNCANWGLIGYSQTTWIGNHLVLEDEIYTEDIEGLRLALAEKYLFLKVQQNDTAGWAWSNSMITAIEYDGAKSRELTSSVRKSAAYKVTVYDTYKVNATDEEPAVFYIVVTGEADFGDLSTITVKPKDPDGIRMNLFDYWINDEDPADESGNPWDYPDNWEIYDGGINYDHALKFFNMGMSTVGNDRSNQIGLWNHSTESNAGNMTGIVQPTLDQRYPRLALDQGGYAATPNPDLTQPHIHTGFDDNARVESLSYLFSPSVKQNGKASHGNVTGLFQRNGDGYYYYDSKLNFAQYDSVYNQFLLYNTWGVDAHSTASARGQFFPFNDAGDVFSEVSAEVDPATGLRTLTPYTNEQDGINSRSDQFNHFFGFNMEIDFQQPTGGMVNAEVESLAQPMVFRFAGDDDVWIFVDGVLVLDLGGVHSAVYGEIDFSTGLVTKGLASTDPQGGAKMGQQWGNAVTLRSLFDAAGVEEDENVQWNGETFASDTLHTINVFYLERGHYDSNLAMYFNLQSRVPHKIYKVDEDGDPLGGATFAIYAAEPAAGFQKDETYHTVEEFVPVNPDGGAASWGTVEPLNADLVTDSDGYVTLSGIDFANRAEKGRIYYILEETSPAPGYRVLPERIILEYQHDSTYPLRGVFRVLNQYGTGAYASFSAIMEDNDEHLFYASAEVDPKTGEMVISKVEDGVIEDFHQKSAMLFAVPMIYTNIGDGPKWYPMYGSNTTGFHVVDLYSEEEYYTHPDNTAHYVPSDPVGQQAAFRWALRHNLLAAAMRQVSDQIGPDWYFYYDTITDLEGNEIYSRYRAELMNLPGDKDRYLRNSEDISGNMAGADLQLVGMLVDAEALVALLQENGTPIILEDFKKLNDEEKYELLQESLQASDFEARWDALYLNGSGSWEETRNWLDQAYVQSTAETTRERGVNLAFIDNFTRYYGSVIYVPNERRELRVLKQGPDEKPLKGAVFGLFETFEDAARYSGEGDEVIVTGTTGENGILIFSRDEDTSPANAGSGWTYMDWDGYTDPDRDNTVWLRELSAPPGYKVNEAIVQVYVGERTIYANASAYRAVEQGGSLVPELIDDLSGVTDAEELMSAAGADGVTVWASVGKLFQSMEKFADPLLNPTLLDIDAYRAFYMPQTSVNDPDNARWQEFTDPLYRLHFWDRRVLGYTSSDYSTAHQRSDGETLKEEVFFTTENGYLQMRPTQTPENVFHGQHPGEDVQQSRREKLFYNNGAPLDLYNIFSMVNVVVIRDEYAGVHVDIEKTQSLTDEADRGTADLTVAGDDIVSYYMTVSCKGDEAAEDVVVTDTVPTDPIPLEYVERSMVWGILEEDGAVRWQEFSETVTGEYRDGTLIWHLGRMEPDQVYVVGFQATVPAMETEALWVNVADLTFANNPDNAPDGTLKRVASNEVKLITSPEECELPVVGGMGTGEFYLFGILLLLAAAFIFMVQYRMKRVI